MPESGAVLQYLQRVWKVVVLRMIIDISAVFLIIAMVVLVAVGLVAVAGRNLGVSFMHVRQAAGIIGGIYVIVIWMRTLRRHWIVAGQVREEKPTATPTAPEVPEGKDEKLTATAKAPEVTDAEPSATSSN